jgi:hypothetical protein
MISALKDTTKHQFIATEGKAGAGYKESLLPAQPMLNFSSALTAPTLVGASIIAVTKD